MRVLIKRKNHQWEVYGIGNSFSGRLIATCDQLHLRDVQHKDGSMTGEIISSYGVTISPEFDGLKSTLKLLGLGLRPQYNAERCKHYVHRFLSTAKGFIHQTTCVTLNAAREMWLTPCTVSALGFS